MRLGDGQAEPRHPAAARHPPAGELRTNGPAYADALLIVILGVSRQRLGGL